jgi:4-oxalocrotonate tautomerase
VPIIRVEMHEGRTEPQKRALAAALTDAIVEHAGAQRDAVRVVFTDYAKYNWAIGGELVSDREAHANGNTVADLTTSPGSNDPRR